MSKNRNACCYDHLLLHIFIVLCHHLTSSIFTSQWTHLQHVPLFISCCKFFVTCSNFISDHFTLLPTLWEFFVVKTHLHIDNVCWWELSFSMTTLSTIVMWFNYASLSTRMITIPTFTIYKKNNYWTRTIRIPKALLRVLFLLFKLLKMNM